MTVNNLGKGLILILGISLLMYMFFRFINNENNSIQNVFEINLTKGNIDYSNCDSFLTIFVTSPNVSGETLGNPNFITGRDTFETCKYLTDNMGSISFDFGGTSNGTSLTMKIKKDSLNEYYITQQEHVIDSSFKKIQESPIKLLAKVDTLILNVDTSRLLNNKPIFGELYFKSSMNGVVFNKKYKAYYHSNDCFVCYPDIGSLPKD